MQKHKFLIGDIVTLKFPLSGLNTRKGIVTSFDVDGDPQIKFDDSKELEYYYAYNIVLFTKPLNFKLKTKLTY